jgi:hypothetical protein
MLPLVSYLFGVGASGSVREKPPISSAKFAVPGFLRRSRHEAFSVVREDGGKSCLV